MCMCPSSTPCPPDHSLEGARIFSYLIKRTATCCSIMVSLLMGLALLAACKTGSTGDILVSGLNQPRGLAFDVAGNLYVAEAGMIDLQADDRSTPIISHSSRVSRISPDGQRETVIDGLPFTNYSVAGDVGATDVAMLDGSLYVLTAEGYDDELSRSVLRVTQHGRTESVANIFRFVERTTAFDSAMGISTLATNPHSMVATLDGRGLYVTDGATGRVFHILLDGTIRVLVELPNKPPVTGLSFGPDGRIYFALFSALPLGSTNGAIWVTDINGEAAVAIPELTLPIDVAFDREGTMYVLEFTDRLTPEELYAHDGGRLLRIADDGTPTVVRDKLNYPTAMTFGPAGDLYISLNGAFGEPGQGAIVKVPCRSLGMSKAACSG